VRDVTIQILITFFYRLILVLSCAFIFFGTAKAEKFVSVGVRDSGKCKKIPYKWLQECKLLEQLRSENYFKVPYDMISDDLLLEHIKVNKPALITELARIDYGRDLQQYIKHQQNNLPNEVVYLSALEQLVDVPWPLEYLNHLVEISMTLNQIPASTVLYQLFVNFKTIIVGIQIYRTAVGIFANERDMLEGYFLDRCGQQISGSCKTDTGTTKKTVWPSFKETYIVSLERISENRHVPLDRLGDWFENAYSAYRLVAFDDSNSIRYLEGIAIAEFASLDDQVGKASVFNCFQKPPFQMKGCEGEMCKVFYEEYPSSLEAKLYKNPDHNSDVVDTLLECENFKDLKQFLIIDSFNEAKVTKVGDELKKYNIKPGDIIQITHYTGEGTWGACIGKDIIEGIGIKGENDMGVYNEVDFISHEIKSQKKSWVYVTTLRNKSGWTDKVFWHGKYDDEQILLSKCNIKKPP
jgi:hypothetical protein